MEAVSIANKSTALSHLNKASSKIIGDSIEVIPASIYETFQQTLPHKMLEFFQDNLLFCFGYGGFLNGLMNFYDDFKVFICLRESDPRTEKSFINYAQKLRVEYGFNLNEDFFIEIKSEDKLQQLLDKEEVDEDDFIRIISCFTGNKSIVYGNENFLLYREKCQSLLSIYNSRFFENRGFSFQNTLATSIYRDKQTPYLKRLKDAEDSLLASFSFEMDLKHLKSILAEGLKDTPIKDSLTIEGMLSIINFQNDLPLSNTTKLMLDGADGSFETYFPVLQAYNNTKSDTRRYIPFYDQYIFDDTGYDYRGILLNFVKIKGVIQASNIDVEHIVTGHGSGYILNKAIQLINNNLGNRFIIPVPTYGYFIPSIEACGAQPIFIDTTHFERFRLPPNILEKSIIDNNECLFNEHIKGHIQKLKRFVLFLKQKIFSSEESIQLHFVGKDKDIYISSLEFINYLQSNFVELQKKHPRLTQKVIDQFPQLPQVKSIFFINPHNPLGIVFDQEYINSIAEIAKKYEMVVIEDLSHMELIYPDVPSSSMGFFNQAPANPQVITLLSPSKALCMAECRVGFAYMNRIHLVHQYKELVFNDGLFLTRKQLNALYNSFVLNPLRSTYLLSNADQYLFRMYLVKFIIYPDKRQDIPLVYYNKIEQLFAHYHLTREEFDSGFNEIELLNPRPESGLFCVLNFDSIRGKYFINSRISNNQDLKALFKIYNMESLVGDDLYCKSQLMIRFPICEPPLLILSSLRRIKKMMASISNFPENQITVSNTLEDAESLSTLGFFERPLMLPEPFLFDSIKTKAIELANRIDSRSDKLKEILATYQVCEVSEYEIERCIRTLHHIEEHINFINGETIDAISVMLPSNLPLYSLIIFAIIPSFQSRQVFLRPNSMLQERQIIPQIFDELDLYTLFPEVYVHNLDHVGFETYVKQSSLVIFTGKPCNAEKFVKIMKVGAILVINGAGHNPLVITDTAEIDKAVDGALLVKGFNGGQDCAGPDAILVHSAIANEFIQKFQSKFETLQTGLFSHPGTKIGPIHRLDELHRLSEILHNNRIDITSGGMIDFQKGIVFPTTIVRGIERYPNYKEVYGPITFIHPYKEDADLAYYFDDPDGKYRANRMYVSVYGQSQYILTRDDNLNPGQPNNVGIVIYDQTVHDIEIGYKPYGGYSLGASGIIKKTATSIQRTSMPILLPEIISEYLIKNKPVEIKKCSKIAELSMFTPSMRSDNEIDIVAQEFKALASNIFGSNLLFGFIFGSAAKGKLKVGGPMRDDLDTFICLHEKNEESINLYVEQLAHLHKKYNLEVDTEFPAEIVTIELLQNMLLSLDELTVSIDKKIDGIVYDHLFWTHTLTDKKIGFIGNGKVMSDLIKQALPHINRWSKQIIQQVEALEVLPVHLQETFLGLSIAQVVDKLKRFTPHLIVHLGLNYSSENSGYGISLK